jgi:hypothetical protein
VFVVWLRVCFHQDVRLPIRDAVPATVVETDWHLQAAFSSSTSVTAVAKEVGHDRRWARLAIQSVAGAWMHVQNLALQKVMSGLGSKRLAVFCEHLSWDEAKQTITADFGTASVGGSLRCRSAWNVMNAKRTFEWPAACLVQ